MMHVHYTVRRKLGLLASAKRIMEEEGVSLLRAAARLQMDYFPGCTYLPSKNPGTIEKNIS